MILRLLVLRITQYRTSEYSLCANLPLQPMFDPLLSQDYYSNETKGSIEHLGFDYLFSRPVSVYKNLLIIIS